MTELPAFWAVRTEFELEPLLEQYVRTYPDGDITKYEIPNNAVDEQPGDHLYLIICFHNHQAKPRETRFEQFLDAFCKLNNKLASINKTAFSKGFESGSAPSGRILGNLESRRKR